MECNDNIFLILKNLRFIDGENVDPINLIQHNLKIIKTYLNLDFPVMYEQCLKHIDYPFSENSSILCSYSQYLYYMLLNIKKFVSSSAKEHMTSIDAESNCLKALVDASYIGVQTYLHTAMRKSLIFKLRKIPEKKYECIKKNSLLKTGLNFLKNMLEIKLFTARNEISIVILRAMAGIYTITDENDSEELISEYSVFLKDIWENTSKKIYFKNLLIIKSIPNLPLSMQKKLHVELIDKLMNNNGFSSFIHNIIEPVSRNEILPREWERNEVVSKAIAHPSHTSKFIICIIGQIFNFMYSCLQNENELYCVDACVLTLRNIFLLNQKYRDIIESKLDTYLFNLYCPKDILTGAIVLDSHEFKIILDLFFSCFCTSSVQTISTEVLIRYLPLFLQLFNQLPNDSREQGQIKSLIIRCLANRDKCELKAITNDILGITCDVFCEYRTLYSRISLHYNSKFRIYEIVIGSSEFQFSYEISNILPKILKLSNNNILIYDIFIIILNLLQYETSGKHNKTSNIDLLESEGELNRFITNKFKIRMDIITCLLNIITYQPFHSQFHETPQEILELLHNFMKATIKKNNFDNDETDQNLSIILAIFQEILKHSKETVVYKNFLDVLKTHLKHTNDRAIKHQIERIISLIDESVNTGIYEEKFNFARSLLNENQSHLRVYGIEQLIELLNDKDKTIWANKHTILALALHILKDEESYTYLNCIRLLVALTFTFGEETLESLSAEYLNENENIEFRLKVGEAILKITESLGKFSYKYKGTLLNCFLYGCKQTKNYEFRASSLSNLATLCSLLCYQIHNFFQELLMIIESIVQTDTNLACRRAAVLVLTKLLFGIDNLIDFGEYLLPLLRKLTYLVENDKDEVTRIHAINGINILNEKCKSFLIPDQNLKKEIKIFEIETKKNLF